MTGKPPAEGTKTREVLLAFNGDETLTAYDVSNRVSFSTVKNDATAVAGYLRTLERRDFIERDGHVNRLVGWKKTLKGRVETEMVEEKQTNADIRAGEDILASHIYELAVTGVVSESTATTWNNELHTLVQRIEEAYALAELEETDG